MTGTTSPWAQHTIWWQVYPLGFVGAPIRDRDLEPGPRLRKISEWLPHAIELGASGLLLGPVFAASSHGYDSVDQTRIDARLGSDEDFDALVTAAHALGMRLLLDGVFSHIGADHPAVSRARSKSPAPGDPAVDIDVATGSVQVFEGHDALVRLDHTDRRTVDYTVDVMQHWLDRGVDGWRLDAAYAVPEAFWARVLPQVRLTHPATWFLGEVIHGDYAAFVASSTVDSVTQYELWKAIWSSIVDRNMHELAWTLRRHDELLKSFLPQTFVGNHDVSRIAHTVGPARAVVAAAVLFTVAGVPSVYSGDEFGWEAAKEERIGGDDAVRPAFPASPPEAKGHGSLVHHAYQELIGLRRRHPWLTSARTSVLEVSNPRIVFASTARQGDGVLRVTVDLESDVDVVIADENGSILWTHRTGAH